MQLRNKLREASDHDVDDDDDDDEGNGFKSQPCKTRLSTLAN